MYTLFTMVEKHMHRQKFFGSRLAQPAVLYNGQRYARTKEPTKTAFLRSLKAPHSKYVRKVALAQQTKRSTWPSCRLLDATCSYIRTSNFRGEIEFQPQMFLKRF